MSRVRFHTADAAGCEAWERIWVFPETSEKIHDYASLFFDLYVIDLQQEKLVMFVGRQM